MAIPSELQTEVDRALEVVKQHPDHEYGPKQRQKLFALFKSELMMKVWKWLAIISAQRVLPIYQRYITESGRTFYYDVGYPDKALEMAKNVLLGKADARTGYDMANGGYDPHDFDYSWRSLEPVPFNVYQAGWAATIALLEASKDDLDQFAGLSHIAYWENGFVWGRDIGQTIQQEYPDSIAGVDFTDSLWAETGHSDTAAVVSTAWACTESSRIPNCEKLFEFWHWWLTVAIPQAWNIVESQHR